MLVTGGAKRLGRDIALRFAREGADVVIHYCDSEPEALDTAAEACASGVQAWTLRADLSIAYETERLWQDAVRTAGKVDVLVNSASIFPEGTLATLDEASLAENMRVNALSPFHLLRHMGEASRPGCVINLLDSTIRSYDRKHAAYHLSKRALYSLTRMAAVEYAPLLRVNAIAPGPVLPPPGEGTEYLAARGAKTLLQAYGSGEHVAEAAVLLARSTFVTGQVIYVDGGNHLKGSMYD